MNLIYTRIFRVANKLIYIFYHILREIDSNIIIHSEFVSGVNSIVRNLWDTKLCNGNFFSGLFGVVSTSSLVRILSLIDLTLPTEKTRTIYVHGEAKFFMSFVPEDCLRGSDSLVIDKCQQVPHKPS